jgi:small subunit ribosomal protein S14
LLNEKQTTRLSEKETTLAKKSWVVKQQKEPKFKVRAYNRCQVCGRSRAFMRDFGICRLCFRKLVANGEVPGVRRASW